MSAEPSARRVGRHDVDIVSLVFGALFTAAAALYGLVEQGRNVPGSVGDWYLPILLIVVGLIGLIGSVGRRPDRGPVEEAAGPNPSGSDC